MCGFYTKRLLSTNMSLITQKISPTMLWHKLGTSVCVHTKSMFPVTLSLHTQSILLVNLLYLHWHHTKQTLLMLYPNQMKFVSHAKDLLPPEITCVKSLSTNPAHVISKPNEIRFP